MSDSCKQTVEEFKKWSESRSKRINDLKSGVSSQPSNEGPYIALMSSVLKDILGNTFNYISNRKSDSVRQTTHQQGLIDEEQKKRSAMSIIR